MWEWRVPHGTGKHWHSQQQKKNYFLYGKNLVTMITFCFRAKVRVEKFWLFFFLECTLKKICDEFTHRLLLITGLFHLLFLTELYVWSQLLFTGGGVSNYKKKKISALFQPIPNCLEKMFWRSAMLVRTVRLTCRKCPTKCNTD